MFFPTNKRKGEYTQTRKHLSIDIFKQINVGEKKEQQKDDIEIDPLIPVQRCQKCQMFLVSLTGHSKCSSKAQYFLRT